jgi:hypothetical protein
VDAKTGSDITPYIGEITMRKEFIQKCVGTQYTPKCLSLSEALEIAPWASTIVEVNGGWMAFESVVDYNIWDSQE